MAKLTKRKAPSRVKYEKDHPTVSCRVSRAIYEQLEAVKATDGKSFADILKLGLGLAKPQVKKADAIRKQSRDEGYRKGYADARLRYAVSYPCSECGQMIEVTSSEEKASIRQHMQEGRWAHSECLKRRRRQ